MFDASTAPLARDWQRTSAPPLLHRLFRTLHDRFAELSGESVEAEGQRSALSPEEGRAWLWRYFGRYLSDQSGQPIPWAERHEAFWQWVWRIQPGISQPAFIGVWPRGGGKSSSAELACAYLGANRLRRYALYVCSTQDQADDHVGTVATLLENPNLGIPRAIGKYGQSKGWRRNRLRTEAFTLDAIGLDSAARGAKIEEARPDLIVLDDLDDEADGERVIARKERALTRKILPAVARDFTVIGMQNIPNPNGIFARLVDGRADYLMDRVISGPFPALKGFDWEHTITTDGRPWLRITHGEPSWPGQNLAACEQLLNLIGLRSFEVEALHKKERLLDAMFHRQWFKIVDDWPRQARVIRFWDLAATEQDPVKANDPDWTAGAKVAKYHGQYWLIDMQHFRASPLGVEQRIAQTAALDGREVDIWLEQEPGSSGVNTISHYQRNVLAGFSVHGLRSTGSKPERAKPASSAAEAGNFFLVRGRWNAEFLNEVEVFPTGKKDDQVDAMSGAVTILTAPRQRAGTWGR